jgi:hypothetical protein
MINCLRNKCAHSLHVKIDFNYFRKMEHINRVKIFNIISNRVKNLKRKKNE